VNGGNKASLYHNGVILSMTTITLYYRHWYCFAGRNGPNTLEANIIKKQTLT